MFVAVVSGITAIEAVAGAPVPAAITGILGAFLALQVCHCHIHICESAGGVPHVVLYIHLMEK